MNDDRTPMEKNRKAFELAYAAIPAITPTKETAWQIWNAALSAAPAQEPVMWQYRWTNPGNYQDQTSLDQAAKWEHVEPRDYIQTLDQRLEELRSYRYEGKPCYEVRPLYASPLPQEPQEGKELTDSDQMRAEFMAWAQDRGCDTDGAWSAWQACWNLRGAQEGKEVKEGEWLPIESAPKNVEWSYGVHGYGKHILGWCPGYEPFRCRWWESKSGACNFIADGGMSCHPTHWQPLPPPPSSTLSASSKGEQR